MRQHVLIVDDEESICWSLRRLLTDEGHEVSVASSAEQALDMVLQRAPDAIVMDVRLPGLDGLAAMKRMGSLIGPVPVIIMTAFGSLDTAVDAIRGGAVDYLPKPFDLERATEVIRRALRSESADGHDEHAADAESHPDTMIGSSAAMQQVFKQIAFAAQTDAPVLITGESGVGKDLVARAIHRYSPRSEAPFVPVHLAALNPSLVESELFGHVKGAFTGADAAKRGLLELADGGTVFLDEIGEVPLALQVKLLRVLEQGDFSPVGSTERRRTSLRIVAATNRNLAETVRDELFRQDLFFRLAAFEITVPPLRDRDEDVIHLARHFLSMHRTSGRRGSAEQGATTLRFTDAAVAELQRRRWPGNVRELRHAIDFAAAKARGGVIEPDHFPAERTIEQWEQTPIASRIASLVRQWAASQLAGDNTTHLHERLLAIVEPPLFDAAMDHTNQNRRLAAELLGIHRETLRRRMNASE